jgi:hypothetical protein
VSQDVQQGHGPVAVLHARRRDHDREKQPSRIDEDMPCAPLHLFVRINAVDPPLSVVFTD